MFALAGCGMVDGKTGSLPPPAQAVPNILDVVTDGPVKVGDPYQVNGVTYTPTDDPAYDETGYASWYGEERAGQPTANAETFNPAAISAAHRTLPLPSYVEVTALDTGRTILVRVNDRGPFADNRVIDLSRGAAEQLGFTDGGTMAVRVRRVNPTEPEKGLLRGQMRAPARMDAPEMVLIELRKRLPVPSVAAHAITPPAPARIAAQPVPMAKPTPKPTPAVKPAPIAQSAPASTRPVMVQIGAYSSKQRADEIARNLGGSVSQAGKLWRVRTGPYPDDGAGRRGIEKAGAAGFPGARIVVND